MSKQLIHKLQNKKQRHGRVRSTISGSNERPRLNVHISNLNVTAQLIDDTKHQTLIYVSTTGKKDITGSMTDKASWVGSQVAEQAKVKKIKRVVFDRGGRIYHGRVAALADSARKGGLEF
jgi:large subunit ribosomal protein L18